MNKEQLQIVSLGIYAAIGAYYAWEGVATKVANFFEKPTRYFLVGALSLGSKEEREKAVMFRTVLRFKGKTYPQVEAIESSMEVYVKRNGGKKTGPVFIDFIEEVNEKDFNSFLPEEDQNGSS